jgi:hypothetical protein
MEPADAEYFTNAGLCLRAGRWKAQNSPFPAHSAPKLPPTSVHLREQR